MSEMRNIHRQTLSESVFGLVTVRTVALGAGLVNAKHGDAQGSADWERLRADASAAMRAGVWQVWRQGATASLFRVG